MAFTANNDINILQASDGAVVGAGAGNDTYVLSPSTLSANQEVTISDTQGANKLQLIGGLTIASSSVAPNGVQLTLSNGAKVTVLGADTFSYEVGGNPLTATAGTVQTYAQFVTTTLGAASVPTTGTVSGTANVTIPGGSTGGGASQAFSLTTGTDTIIGSSTTNETVTGTATTYADTDRVIDTSTSDSDVYNVTVSANPAIDSTNIEAINVTTAATGSLTVDTSKMSGVKVLTVTPGDLSVGGSTIAGDKTVSITRVDSSKVNKIVTGTGATVVTIDQSLATVANSKAGVVIDAATATRSVTVTGATTLDAANAAATAGDKVIVKAINGATAAENNKAVTVNAAKAKDVEINDNTSKFTGAITVNAAEATEVQVENGSGGVTINAAKAALSTGNGIVVAGLDDSGATITTGSFGKNTAGTISEEGKISVDGSGSSDAATITAAGFIALTSNATNQIETLNLSGNGATVRYNMTGAATTYNLTGDKDVVLAGNVSSFDGKTVNNTTTAGTTTLQITTLNTADLSKVKTNKIEIAADAASKTLTVADGANVVLAKDITTALNVAGKTVDSTLNISTGDDTNASGATIDITTGTLDFATNLKTVNLDASVGKLTLATATTLAATATLNISGSKAVSLGTVTAKEVNASSSTGKITLTASGANTSKTITTGSGGDDITLNQAVKFTVDAGNGDNTVTITAADTASSIATGTGADTINLNSANALVIVTGAGDDTVTTAQDTDAIIVMGDGTGDKLAFTTLADLSNNANFAYTGVEIIEIKGIGEHTINAKAFAGDNTFKLVGTAVATDILKVFNTSTTAGAVIDASGVTFSSTQDATLNLQGAAKLADTITGSAKNDTITASTGADIVNGGEGTDTFLTAALADANIEGTGTGTSAGVVVNLGTSAVTNTTVLAKIGAFTANSVTSVDGGKTAYTFSAAASTNSAVQQTLSSIENVTGTTGRDFIVGSANDNVITAGAGADYVDVGVGTDTIVLGASAHSFAGAAITSSTTVLTGLDVVKGMAAGDKIDISGILNTFTGAAGTTVAAASGTTVSLVRGDYDAATGIWTTGAGADTLFVYDVDGAGAGTNVGAIALIGVSPLAGTAAAGVLTLA